MKNLTKKLGLLVLGASLAASPLRAEQASPYWFISGGVDDFIGGIDFPTGTYGNNFLKGKIAAGWKGNNTYAKFSAGVTGGSANKNIGEGYSENLGFSLYTLDLSGGLSLESDNGFGFYIGSGCSVTLASEQGTINSSQASDILSASANDSAFGIFGEIGIFIPLGPPKFSSYLEATLRSSQLKNGADVSGFDLGGGIRYRF